MKWIRFRRVLIGLSSLRNVHIIHWAIQESVTWRLRLEKVRTSYTTMARVSPGVSHVLLQSFDILVPTEAELHHFTSNGYGSGPLQMFSLLVRNKLEKAIRITAFLDVTLGTLLRIEHYALETGQQTNVYTSRPTLTDLIGNQHVPFAWKLKYLLNKNSNIKFGSSKLNTVPGILF
jgi:hypothetical protein